jgi:hypothetical protein
MDHKRHACVGTFLHILGGPHVGPRPLLFVARVPYTISNLQMYKAIRLKRTQIRIQFQIKESENSKKIRDMIHVPAAQA